MTGHDPIQPPKWPLKILKFFVRKNYLEEIEGDMEEVFHDNLSRFPLRKARRMYAIDVLKLLRPVLMKNLGGVHINSQQAMFINYFKISLRGLMRNPLNSFINVFGLAAAIGICVFAYAFARWTYSTDQFHELRNEVYLTTFFADRDGSAQQYGTTPAPLGELLKQDIPQIKKVCRVEDRTVIVKHGPEVFNERIRYTDPEFLEMLTFPLKWGSAVSLQDINSMIISEDMSAKYFGEANPVGSTMLVKFDQHNSKEFKITGVAAEFPKARTISFNFLVNIENLDDDFHDWKSFVDATLIQVPNPADTILVYRALEKYKALQNTAVTEDWAISSFALEPLATLHEKSTKIRDDISRGSDANYTTIIYLLVVAVTLLALACFNYINIAIVTSAKRLKEIGVRKSIGASRKAVIIQFLSENVVVMLFAMIVGVALGAMFFIPAFEQMWSFSMDFKLSDPVLWIYLPAVLLVTGLGSGIYPSLYISKFQVVGILKGSVRFGQRNPMTRVFLGAQLVICCIFITGAIMFAQNTLYLSERPWGYDQSSAMYTAVPNSAAFDQLGALMTQDPDVLSIAGSVHHLGKAVTPTIIHFPDRDYEVDQLEVDAQYFETMGIKLKDGRSFESQEGSDRNAVIVNELLVENLKWGNAIGQGFRIDSIEYQIIGVVTNFHSFSFSKPIRPTIFKVADHEAYRYLTLKVTAGEELKTYKALQDNWALLFPETPFNGGLQEDIWGFYFEEINIYARVWKVISFIAVTLAALGLYGLISLNVEGRVREFSIRKVMGARVKHISKNIISQYVLLFVVALLVGAPAGHMLMSMVITSSFEYHVPITFSAVTGSCVMVVFILLITVSTQVRKVMRSNPVEGLKAE